MVSYRAFDLSWFLIFYSFGVSEKAVLLDRGIS